MFTLNEAHEALNGHDEFVVKVYDGKICFDYIVIFPGSFDATEDEIRNRAYYLWEKAGGPVTDSEHFWHQAEADVKKFANIRRNFRGVTFDAVTGEMISLPLHKFFNVNQIPETQFDVIKHHDSVIYEKADGSLIHFMLFQGQLLASTCRSANTPQAIEALSLAKSKGLESKIIETIKAGYTPVFEFVAPHNQIVVRYNEPDLIYLISRERATGKYHFDESFPNKVRKFEFKFNQVFNNLDVTEFEGYICHLPNMIVKVKTPWYMERHRAVDSLMRPAYKLYQVVFDGHMDDLIAISADSYKPVLRKIYEEAQRDLLVEKRRVEQEFEEILALAKDQDFGHDVNPLINLKNEIDALKLQGKTMEAIKRVREITGLGLLDSKVFVEKGVLPHGVILRDEQDAELQRLNKNKKAFVDLANQNYPEDFGLIMALYQGHDPSKAIQEKLMEVYRLKYPQKLYSGDERDFDGTVQG